MKKLLRAWLGLNALESDVKLLQNQNKTQSKQISSLEGRVSGNQSKVDTLSKKIRS